ncbi:MAG: DUF748 domain-containing protein [Sulfuricella sp.]|nr:DUF748 domain-containing protein [Sulfuricella sp.]
MKIPHFSRLPKPARLALWSAAALLALALLVSFGAPPLARNLIERGVSAKLQRIATVREVVIHPLQLSVSVRGLELREADGKTPAAGFAELFIDLEAASLLRGSLMVQALRVDQPYLKVIRSAPHRYNFSDVIETLLAKQDDSPPPHFSLSNLQLENGRIDFDDQALRQHHEVSDIRLALPFLSNLPSDSAILVHPAFSARVNGHPVALGGETRPFAEKVEAHLNLEVADLDLPKLLAYLPTKPPLSLTHGQLDSKLALTFTRPHGKAASLDLKGDVVLKNAALVDAWSTPLATADKLKLRVDTASPLSVSRRAAGRLELAGLTVKDRPAGPLEIATAKLAGSTRFSFEMAGDTPQLKLDELSLALDQLGLRLPGESKAFFTAETLTLRDARLDLAQRQVEIGSLTGSAGKLALRRLADGTLDLAKLAAQRPSENDKAAPPGAPWRVSLKKLDLDGYALRFEERLKDQTLVFSGEPLSLSLENLSTDPAAKTQLALRTTLNGKGTLAATGEMVPAARQANLKLGLANLDITAFQPYFAERLNLTLRQGTLAAKGSLAVALPPDGAAPKIAFNGEANLSGLHTLDAGGSNDLLKWKSLYFGGIQAATAPPAFAVEEIALSDFYSRLTLNPDGTFNLQQLLRPAPAATPAAAPAPATGAPTPIKIGKVTLQGGTIQFSDRYIKPNYSARLTDIGGRIAGLASNAPAPTELDLRGKLDGAAPLQINGRIDPLGKELFADIKAAVKGIDLTPFNPYAAKYAGYAIEKGKLSLDVSYHIENRKLDAQNSLFLDQLTFGERVASPTATQLPVLLAVALLKNSKGEIDLHLPIGGSLDDPQFSVGEVIGKVIGNLIWKTVSAPFTFLASLFGGDSEALGWLEFEAGRATIPAAGADKLQTLAKALAAKPGINLEITGRADPATDREGLKHARLERKLKTLKNADLAQQGSAAASLDAVDITAEEYPALLKRVYLQEDFPKPRNFVGMTKDLPAPEMEKLLFANSPTSDDDLRNLANRRTRAARDWLIEKGGIPAERIFQLAPKLATGDEKTREKEKNRGSRVDFSLTN